MLVSSYGPLDGALDRLAGYGPGLANGNFSHAPMVAESAIRSGLRRRPATPGPPPASLFVLPSGVLLSDSATVSPPGVLSSPRNCATGRGKRCSIDGPGA